MTASLLPLFVTSAPGLEGLLATELSALGARGCRPGRSGVVCEADPATACRICLWTRLGHRVLLQLCRGPVGDADDLYRLAAGVDWSAHLGPEQTLAVDVVSVRSVIRHSHYAALKVKDAVVDRIRTDCGARPSVQLQQPDVRIHVYLQAGEAGLSLDLAGDRLHRRGYRTADAEAPLRETLAAAMLIRGGWPDIAAAGGLFVDPMCGSGTLLIEAAWMASDTAPGLLRTRFGFTGWRQYRDDLWKPLLDEALDRQERGLAALGPITGIDRDPQALTVARENLRRAGLAGRVQLIQGDCLEEAVPAFDTRPPLTDGTAPRGLVATNPPYGQRLQAEGGVERLHLRLGETLRQRFPGWRAMVLHPTTTRLGLRPDRSWPLRNGPIDCLLERFEFATEVSARLVPEPPGADAAPLANRLRKNLKRLRPWLERESVHAFRVYDADLPEFALAIDVYDVEPGQRWLHVQEYAAPPSVDPERARLRLEAALAVLPVVPGVTAERVVLKTRERQRGAAQYQRQGQQRQWLTLPEGDARLLVNLTDYLDTGVFLDHRPLRAWLRANAAGKRFLNLFCYTATATVQAALGGAVETVSVDLSATYLDWAQRNCVVNRLGPGHRLVRADCLDWLLAKAAAAGPDAAPGSDSPPRPERWRPAATESEPREGLFDLILLDPPSFSNSQRMQRSLDVQRDHVRLLESAMALLAADGILLFSTNLRRFRLDPLVLERFRVDDIGHWSRPPDFERNRRIHQCWQLRHRV